MAQGVQARGGRDFRRGRHGEPGIADRQVRHQHVPLQQHLNIPLRIGNDGKLGRLGAGARRGRDGGHGGHFYSDSPAEKIADGPAVFHQSADGLHGVDRASASDSHQEVTSLSLVLFQAVFNHDVGRFPDDLGVDGAVHPLPSQDLLHLGAVADLDHNFSGDDHGLFAHALQLRGRRLQRPRAGEDAAGHDEFSCHTPPP